MKPKYRNPKYLKKTKTSKKPWLIAAAALAVVLIAVLCISLRAGSGTDVNPALPNTSQDGQSGQSSQNSREELRLPDLLGTAKTIKRNLVSALEDMKQGDYDEARRKMTSVREDIAAVHKLIGGMPLLLKLIPQAQNIHDLLGVADMAIPDILLPAIDLMEARPLSGLSVGDGFDTKLLCEYVDFLDSVMPKLEELTEAANSVNFKLLDSDGKIAESLDSINGLVDIYRENPSFCSMLKAMLGGEEDRTYLMAVQNPAEIRASGGFPGSMSTMRIQDGILTIGDFVTVTNVLTFQQPRDVQITTEEYALFSYLAGMQAPRDADLCPDFERVGSIWAISYEQRHNEPLAGVISLTPHLVQRFLDVLDQEIELSEGFLLNGDNAMKVLLHDIYFKYYDRYHPHPNRHVISDQLFAEAAKKTMELLTSDISTSKLIKLLPVLKDSFADRTLMLWMKEEEEQAFVVDRGWSAGLNKDPEKPQAGIYFNCVSASKMGWFTLMDTEVGKPSKNRDGSYTYPITVTLTNNISDEEIQAASRYISGVGAGAFQGVTYFFAPAGGSVGNFTASNGQEIPIKTYNGMTLGFMDMFILWPNKPITITYTVTTAPGVDTPLVLSKTPTAQQSSSQADNQHS